MVLSHTKMSILYGAESHEGEYPLWRCVIRRRVSFMVLSHTKESILYGAESHEGEYPLWC